MVRFLSDYFEFSLGSFGALCKKLRSYDFQKATALTVFIQFQSVL